VFRTNTFPQWAPFIDTSILGQKFSAKQAILKECFVQNPTPACVKEIPDKDDDHVPKIPVVIKHATAAQPPLEQDQQEFSKLMVETMQKMQHAPLQGQTKILVKSCDHKETINAAKLQNSMVRIMYAMTKTVNWEDGTIKSISLATFTQEYQNLLERSVSVQVTQLANLFRTIFSTEPNKDNNSGGPLNRLMFLCVFPLKITKGHLNATFQSNDLEIAAIFNLPFPLCPAAGPNFGRRGKEGS
jgi:hypothetical protein